MKKVGLMSILFLVMLIFASCVTENVTYSSDSSNIKFEYFYRGFATIKGS